MLNCVKRIDTYFWKINIITYIYVKQHAVKQYNDFQQQQQPNSNGRGA